MSRDSDIDVQPRWASIDVGAEHIGVHPRTIRRAIAEGRITGYRIGKRAIRVDLNEIEALLEPIPVTTTHPRKRDVRRLDPTGSRASSNVDLLDQLTPEERRLIRVYREQVSA